MLKMLYNFLMCVWKYKMYFSLSFFSLLANEDFIPVKRANIPKHDTLGRVHNVSLKECDKACYKIAECKSYEYKENNKICDLSNVTHLTHDLQPNIYGWEIHILNPGQ